MSRFYKVIFFILCLYFCFKCVVYAHDKVYGVNWKYKTDGWIFSEPLVTHDVAYIGNFEGALYALEKSSGRELWKYSTREGMLHDYFKSPPVIYQNIIIVGGERLYAIDAFNGKGKWTKTLDSDYSPPILIADSVLAGSYDGLYLIDVNTGKLKWMHKLITARRRIFTSVAGSTIYYGFEGGTIVGVIDLNTGLTQKDIKVQSKTSSPFLVCDGNIIYGDDDGYLYSIDANTGKENWRFKTGRGVSTKPVVAGGLIYFASSDSHIYALDITTGKEKWRYHVADSTLTAPCFADNIIYFGSEYDSEIFALNAATGEKEWSFKAWGHFLSGIDAPPIVVDGSLYFNVNSYLYSLDVKAVK